MASLRAVFIVAAKRTPFGTFGGALKAVSATDLSAAAARAALEAGKVPPEAVDSVIVGNVMQVTCTRRDGGGREGGRKGGCVEWAWSSFAV